MFAAGFLEAKMTLPQTLKHTQNFMNATFPMGATKTPALLATATSFVTSNGRQFLINYAVAKRGRHKYGY